MGIIVIAAYRPKAGQEAALKALVTEHVPVLREQGLATERPPVVMEAADGTILELFEWTSAEAIEEAHANAAVGRLWDRFHALCDYVPLADLKEAHALFAEFAPVARDRD